MPLGFERLNERSQRPNALINFIKPLKSSSPEDQAIAQDFLERIAAQCYPVMKRDVLRVMSLEEHEANPQFLGCNYNAGEAIQLVLKDKSGRWLSFRFVQMVMMHELAHCKQMNHSRNFWKVRNQYADHMKELWEKKYEGEGVWGRGQNLTNGNYIHDHMPDNAQIPEHLCGGTYRRKRKRGKKNLTYAERKEKRISKKFGVHGEGHDLGEDELVRGALEKGKRRHGKPRVAKSQRGRDLRANAALARIEAEKMAQQRQSSVHTETDSGDLDSEDDFDDTDDDLETLGKITDQRARDRYQVCGDEGEQQEGGEEEINEFRRLGVRLFGPIASGTKDSHLHGTNGARAPKEDSETESEPDLNTSTSTGRSIRPAQTPKEDSETEGELDIADSASTKQGATYSSNGVAKPSFPNAAIEKETNATQTARSATTIIERAPMNANSTTCPQCTVENDRDSATCIVCSNVLKPSLMSNHWRCKSDACRGTTYINAGDAGRCGLCGGPKQAATQPMGVVGLDVLRWD